jgi:hypothetical protein
MRTTRDAIRSLARYMTESFGEDWEVGYFSQQGTFARPGIAVRTTGPLLSAGSRHTLDLTQPMAIYVYPAEKETVEETFDEVMQAEEKLWQAFNIGVGEGRPFRVPLYDYEGVPYDDGSSLRRYPDYLRVVDCSIERAQSADDEKKWTVTAELRLTWRRAGEMPTGKRVATDLKQTIAAELGTEITTP